MNKVELIGNLTDNPKMTTTQSGIIKCDFRLAVQRRFVNQQTGKREADFIPIVAWRQLAELCGKYLSKGRKCAIVGSIQTRSYEAQDGTKRYITEIVADEVEFLGSNQQQSGQNNAAQAQYAPPQGDSDPTAGFTQVDDDELPF